MFILFGFLFYLSSILEDKFQIDGIKKGLLLAIPLLALSLSSYFTGKKIKDNLQVMKWVTFIGIVLAGASVAVISFRSEERRVGKECRFRWGRDYLNTKVNCSDRSDVC